MKLAILLFLGAIGCGDVTAAPGVDAAGGAAGAAVAAGASGGAAGSPGAAGQAGAPGTGGQLAAGGAAGASGGAGGADTCNWPALSSSECQATRACVGAPGCQLCCVVDTASGGCPAGVMECQFRGVRCVNQCSECGGTNPGGAWTGAECR